MNFLLRLLRHWPILLLAIWFGGMTILLDRAVDLFAKRTTPNLHDLSAPAPWRHSRLFVDPDAYAWLAYASDLRASPYFRVRWTHMDNAPYGRPVHWSQLPIWSLCSIATALGYAGFPAPDSLEIAGRILLPLLGFLFFSSMWLFLRHRIPPGLSALVVLSATASLFWNFHPLRPDHHGFQLAAFAAFAFPLLFSSFGFAPPTRRNRMPFVVSGFFGGTALWFGATIFYFALASSALAAALALLPHHPSSDARQDPVVWRLWGLAGFASSIIFWLLEYAPRHFSMRLEANHPLYALSFLGIGECLYLLARFRHDPATRISPVFFAHTALAIAAAVALPCLVLFGPNAWYLPRSVPMLRLHARHIIEFLSLQAYCAQGSQSFFVHLVCPLLPALAALPFSPRPFARRHLFAIPFFCIFLALFLWQNRWEPFVTLASCLLVSAAVPGTSVPQPSRKTAGQSRGFRQRAFRFVVPSACALQIVLMIWGHVASLASTLRGTHTDPGWHRAFQYRALATQFARALDDPSVTQTPNASSPVILAPNGLAPYFYYFARVPSVSSFYWENLPGNVDAAEAFGDPEPSAPDALGVVDRRHVSHLVMIEGAQDAILFDHLRSGIYSTAHVVRTLGGTLAGAIPNTPLPPWLCVDTDLNRLSNPTLYTFIPPRGFFAPSRLPVRIYSLMPPP